jgi:hypothetical protein
VESDGESQYDHEVNPKMWVEAYLRVSTEKTMSSGLNTMTP